MPFLMTTLAMSILLNLFMGAMIIQVELTPRDNVIIQEMECPEVVECKETEIIMEDCDPDILLDNCTNEKFEYGEQLDQIDRIINPNKIIN